MCNKWKNHFSQMKRMYGCHLVRFPSKVPVHGAHQLLCFGGMPMNPKADLNPVPVDTHVLLKGVTICPQIVSTRNRTNHIRKKQRLGMGVINDCLSCCRYVLFSLLFHEVTSLHPPSFQRNDFSLVQ